MANAGDIIVDGLLCFLSSANNDFSNEGLLDIAHSFYSHDVIKNSKTVLGNILHKDVVWRRDPEKKKKDLRNVVDFMMEMTESKVKVKFVADSYKGMPPVGLEFIAPLLSNLSGEMSKINDILPGILDIKSEVVNMADTVRQLRSDVTDIKGKFTSAVAGMEEATKDIVVDDLDIINGIKSFRKSLTGGRLSFDANENEERPIMSDDTLISNMQMLSNLHL